MLLHFFGQTDFENFAYADGACSELTQRAIEGLQRNALNDVATASVTIWPIFFAYEHLLSNVRHCDLFVAWASQVLAHSGSLHGRRRGGH